MAMKARSLPVLGPQGFVNLAYWEWEGPPGAPTVLCVHGLTRNGRDFDFLASRFWAHRKLWETAYIGPSPIFDPDLPEDQQPILHGLALPDDVMQKLYRDNAIRFYRLDR